MKLWLYMQESDMRCAQYTVTESGTHGGPMWKAGLQCHFTCTPTP